MNGPPITMSGQDIVIPDKSAFKASEVCEIAKVQPYVLRSWENEFHELGVSRTPGGPRVYRKADVERVLQIRHLVLAEGLTLAGVRRKLEGAGVTPGAGGGAAERRGSRAAPRGDDPGDQGAPVARPRRPARGARPAVARAGSGGGGRVPPRGAGPARGGDARGALDGRSAARKPEPARSRRSRIASLSARAGFHTASGRGAAW